MLSVVKAGVVVGGGVEADSIASGSWVVVGAASVDEIVGSE